MEVSSDGKFFVASIDNAGDIDAVNPNQKQVILETILSHKIIVIKKQNLSPKKLVSFAKIFGNPKKYFVENETLNGFPEVIEVTNRIKETSKPHVYASHWHTDDSYRQEPATLTFMYPKILPQNGGGTDFIDCCAVYEELPAKIKNKIQGLNAVHKWQSRRNVSPVSNLNEKQIAETPDAVHPLVRKHPISGKKSVFINPNRIDHIIGLSDEESDLILDELYEFSFQTKFQYHHMYAEGDFVIWDNRNTMHRANSDYDTTQLRIMHRVMLEGEPVCS